MPVSASSGVTSGIDYNALLDQLIKIQRSPIRQLEIQRAALEKQNKAYDSLAVKLTTLQNAAEALATTDDFVDYTAVSSDDSILTATADSAASNGNYSIVVNTLAQAHKIAADGVATETTTIAAGAGVFEFTIGGGATESVAVDATTTLSDLRNAINALDSGVTATIINDGDAVSPYRLILTADDTGVTNDIALGTNNTSLAFNTTLQAAQDASLTVDGLAITRSTNTITDVITGVNIELSSADAGTTVSLGVSTDTAAMKGHIEDFIKAYNDIALFIKTNNRYDTETKQSKPFFGETAARGALSDIRSVITGQVSGLTTIYDRLINIGVETSGDALLKLDGSDFDSALAADFDAVVNLFTGEGAVDGLGTLLADKIDELTDFAEGRITNKKKNIEKRIDRIDTDVERKQFALTKYEQSLRAQFTGLEVLLATMQRQSTFLASL